MHPGDQARTGSNYWQLALSNLATKPKRTILELKLLAFGLKYLGVGTPGDQARTDNPGTHAIGSWASIPSTRNPGDHAKTDNPGGDQAILELRLLTAGFHYLSLGIQMYPGSGILAPRPGRAIKSLRLIGS